MKGKKRIKNKKVKGGKSRNEKRKQKKEWSSFCKRPQFVQLASF